jgi:hypothetical protein
MTRVNRLWFMLCALYELARFEVIVALSGSGSILEQLRNQPVSTETGVEEKMISDAVLLATCFYFKPVLCLQRAACTVRLLRKHGTMARLVVGYRPSPFFSHAWVEVDGRVVYGSAAYQKRLIPLHVV